MERNKDSLGYYLVGWKKFYNKTLALIESKRTGYDVKWIFNDPVYDSIDWTIPIETPLFEIYRQRAQQLRDKYDYLMLYYSGGADSSTILRTFVENNIFLDEIVMQLPEPVRQSFDPNDTSEGNFYAELEYSAVPYLNKIRNKLHPNTLIRYQDFSKPGLELLKQDDWFESVPLCTNITLSGVFRQIAQNSDHHILNLYDTGKSIAQILGIDKPLVYFNGTDYYCYFMDTSTYHYVSPVDFNDSELSKGKYSTEFFYWTPDMPEIVVKQAQDIKRNCEMNTWAKFMAGEILTRHISEYRPVLHPVIYPDDVTVEFQTEKPSTRIVRAMDRWFWETASQKVQGNYLSVIDYIKQHTNEKHMIKNDINNGIAGHKTKFYKL
jgi:hypothetical protein